MSVQPAIYGGNLSTPAGIAQSMADLRRRLQRMEAERTIIGSGAIVGGQISSGSIGTAHIVTGAITAELISALAINAGHIQANAITSNHIAANQITATHIASGSIQAGHIQAGAIEAGSIAAGAITTDKLAANSVVAGKIAADAVTTNTLAAGAVTAAKMSITGGLSSITANLGSVTAGTITGATIQSATTGSRVVMSSTGLIGYASNGTTKTFEIDTGSGTASFTGTATLNAASIVPSAALGLVNFGGGNLVPNSSFEQGLDAAGVDRWLEGWSASASTLTKYTTDSYSGSNSVSVAATATSSAYVGRNAGSDRIPVVPGIPYTFSAWAKEITANALGHFGQMYIEFYQADNSTIIFYVGPSGTSIATQVGANISGVPTNNGSVLLSSTQWRRTSYTLTAPPLARFARVYWRFYGGSGSGNVVGDTCLVDAFQVEAGDTPSAYSPKNDEILYRQINTVNLAAGAVTANTVAAGAISAQSLSFVPVSQNMLRDAGFEFSGTESAWEVSANSAIGTMGTPRTGTRTWALRQTSSAAAFAQMRVKTADSPYITATKTYTASAYIRQKVATSGRSARIIIEWLNSSDAVVSTTTGTAVALPADNTTWTRVTGTGASAATAVRGRMYVRFEVTAGTNFPGTTEEVDIEDAQFEPGETATSWAYEAGDIQPGSVGNTQITANAVTTDKILAGTIIGSDIAATTITATNIASNTITATQLSATAIDAMTVTGATIQSALPTVPNRTVLNSSGMTVWANLTIPTLAGNVALATSGTGSALGTTEYWWLRCVLIDANGVETSSVQINGSEAIAITNSSYGVSADIKIDTRASNYRIYLARRTGSAGTAPPLSEYDERGPITGIFNPVFWQDAGIYRISLFWSDTIAATSPPIDIGGTNNTSAASVSFAGSTATIRGAVYETAGSDNRGPRTTLDIEGLKALDKIGNIVAQIKSGSSTSAIDLQSDQLSGGGRPVAGNISGPNQYAIRWRGAAWAPSSIGSIMAWEDITTSGLGQGSGSNLAMYATDGTTAQTSIEITSKVPDTGTNRFGRVQIRAIADSGGTLGATKNLLTYLESTGKVSSDWQLANETYAETFVGAYSTVVPPNGTTGAIVAINGGHYLISLCGTSYSSAVQNQYLDLFIDGVLVMNTRLFFNSAGVHQTFPARWLEVSLSAGTHYFFVRSTGPNDANDQFSYSVTPA